MSAHLNRAIAAELDNLTLHGILTAEQARRIGERYPTERWDVLVLVRWFTVLGGVAAGVGAVLLANEFATALRLGEVGLAAGVLGFLLLARWLTRSRGLARTGAALEMLAGFSLQGLTFLLAIDFSTGSHNWPALVGAQTVLLTALAYGLRNRLILTHAAVCFFVYFGGETGYISGWGAYWLKMNYPARFLAAGLGFLAVAAVHATRLRGVYQSFDRVYAHLGFLVIHLAFWFFALFGYFGEEPDWTDNAGQRLAFSVLWAAVCVASIWAAGVTGQRMLRGYGLTFLIIDIYTFYFQFVVAHSAEAWWLHLLLVGGSLVALGAWLERWMRQRGIEGAGEMERREGINSDHAV
jgi:hypothetical protein